MSDLATRPTVASLASRRWDVVVVGGGIIGAGIVREVARLGARALLVERGDFACGTSSRSSKLVHGGLHYLARLQVGLACSACRARETLIETGGDLVRPVPFVLPVFGGNRYERWKLWLALAAYGLLGRARARPRRVGRYTLEQWFGGLTEDLSEAFVYRDAVTDDSALVLRALREACTGNATVVNYVEATRLLRGVGGDVVGVAVRDGISGSGAEVRARAVVNAAGPWGDDLRRDLGLRPRVRWVRGSHLVLSRPISREHAMVTLHPDSGRPFYLLPWGGRTLVGSTNVEERVAGSDEKRIGESEVAYLARGITHLFPGRNRLSGEVVSTFSGIRPIVDRDAPDPARASREHGIWEEHGLVTVTGGKLTTFHSMAEEVVDRLRRSLPGLATTRSSRPPLQPLDPLPRTRRLDPRLASRIQHRHGTEAALHFARLPDSERRPLDGLGISAGMLRWIARREAVVHLDDLMLRRTRIGLTVRDGGCSHLSEVRPVVQSALGWTDRRWCEEAARYRRIWRAWYAPPDRVSTVTEARER